MTPDELLDLADNPEHISGIYNYCDRWCERCKMTSRCLVFATMQLEEAEESDISDINQDAFWKKIQGSFAMTLMLMQRFAKEQGISLESSPEEDEAYYKKHKAKREAIAKAPIVQLANSYINLGKDWFDRYRGSMVKKEEELNQALQLGLPERKPQEEAIAIQDALEIISWYLHQICVKMMRAHNGRRETDEWNEENGFPKDSDGSAKVALIGIDNSMKAWGHLLNHFQEQEETILEILAVLERLVRMIETEFPRARSFVRPGFDD